MTDAEDFRVARLEAFKMWCKVQGISPDLKEGDGQVFEDYITNTYWNAFSAGFSFGWDWRKRRGIWRLVA